MTTLVRTVRNRVKGVVRQFVPPHVVLRRNGENFLARGEREVRELPCLVVPGTVALDVGANLGQYAYAIMKLTQPSQLICIEPLPYLAEALEAGGRWFGWPITVHAVAASDRTGRADIFVPQGQGRAYNALATLHPSEPGARAIGVPLRRIDDLCADVQGPIGFVKVDVEGHELAALRGATGTLARHRPTLLIEIEQRHSPHPVAETFAHMASLGYEAFFIDADGRRVALDYDVAERQHATLAAAGTAGYVNNFLFIPRT